jgi:hypothetical protein
MVNIKVPLLTGKMVMAVPEQVKVRIQKNPQLSLRLRREALKENNFIKNFNQFIGSFSSLF